jgi:hypothetical protein
MFKHWLHCHAIFDEDKKHLRHVYELRYEDYVEFPDRYHEEIAAFLGTSVPEPPAEDHFRTVAHGRDPISSLRVPEKSMEETSGAHNRKYFDRWRELLCSSPFKSYYRYVARRYEKRFAQYGYSLLRDCAVDKTLVQGGGKISDLVGVACCRGAEAHAWGWRTAVRAKERLRLAAKAMLPEFIVEKLRLARDRAIVKESHAGATIRY